MLTSYQTQRATETGLKTPSLGRETATPHPPEEAQGEAHNPGLSKGAFRCEPNAPAIKQNGRKLMPTIYLLMH